MAKIDARVNEVLANYKLPEKLGFGLEVVPIMVEMDHDGEKWSDIELKPYSPLTIDPRCKVLHYAQEIFEGLKGYKNESGDIFLFRPDMNAKRFKLSAQKMCLPDVPEKVFVDACELITKHCAPFIPTKMGDSLYLRPFMFATQDELKLNKSLSHKFMDYRITFRKLFWNGRSNSYND